MRLVQGSLWFGWGGVAAVLYAGTWLPGPHLAARPDATVAAVDSSFAALPDPAVSALPDPIVAAFSDPIVATRSDPIVVALADPGVIALSHPIIAALPGPNAADPDDKVSAPEASDECVVTEGCIDQYLWSVYERTLKVDTIKVPEKKKVKVTVTVKKKGKKQTVTKTVTKTVIKLVDEDFTWKDPKAAEKTGMPLMDYVIGGMDQSFKLKLYRTLRAMDEAGLAPGITSGFRDDYRQEIASGNKAATDSSFHGGSRRGGYGHGLAADLVSVKGKTRSERWVTSEALWKWVDAHGQQFGIGRPYLDRDPPHVGPIDGKEYAAHRGLNAQQVALGTKNATGWPQKVAGLLRSAKKPTSVRKQAKNGKRAKVTSS